MRKPDYTSQFKRDYKREKRAYIVRRLILNFTLSCLLCLKTKIWNLATATMR